MKKIILLIWGIIGCQCVMAQTYTIAQLKDSALHHNMQIRNARINIAVADQQRKEAFTKFFPNVSGTGFTFRTDNGMADMRITPSEVLPTSYAQLVPPEAAPLLADPINMSMMKKGSLVGISAVQPIFTGGQVIQGNKLAKVSEQVRGLQLHLSENEVRKTVEEYFWQLVSIAEKIRTSEAIVALLNDIRKDVNTGVAAGVAMRNDLLQIQLRLNEMESLQLTLANNQAFVKLLMAQYCGLRDTSFQIVCDTESTPTLATQHNHDEALHRTVEYQLLDKQVRAADLQKKMTIGQQLPSVAVGAGYNYHNMLGNNHRFGMVFATVSVPISGWWGGTHAIKRKKLEYQQALEQKDNQAEMLKIRMQKAWNDVDEGYRQLLIAQRSIEQAEENLRLHRQYYKAGVSKMSELLEAQMLYQQACDKRTDAYADYQNRRLTYQQAVGM